MVKRRKNRYRPLANPTHCARCGSTNLAIKNDAKPEIQNDGATPSFFCTDCRTRCHTAIVEEHQSRLDNTRQLAIMRGLSSTEDTRTERWLVTCDDIVRQNCPASTIFAGPVASISFAGSPPRPGRVAGQRWCGSWGRQTPG